MELTELIGACCVCDKIRIDNEKNLWLSRCENPELYNRLLQGKELTHGYCPEHYQKALKELEEYKRKKKE